VQGLSTRATYDRDGHGQLTRLTDDSGQPLFRVDTWAAPGRPGRVTQGPLTREDEYDPRGRLTMRTYSVGSTAMAQLVYGYDGADRETSRMYSHLGNRADQFGYDVDGRVTSATMNAQPDGAGGWGPGDYSRTYVYDASGEDRLVSIQTSVTGTARAPAVASSLPAVDVGGFTTQVDGLTRTADALGNTQLVETRHGETTLAYDGYSRLRRATRVVDGSVVDYEYRSDGMLSYRKVTCAQGANDCVSTERLYVYQGLHLLQELELLANGTVEVAGQYYYTDESDIPAAADLRASTGAPLQRYYYLVDRQGSVLGVVDAQGQWQERTSYDVFGAPRIQGTDVTPAQVKSLTGSPAGTLEIRFSEPVFPLSTYAGRTGVPVVLTDVFQVQDGAGMPVPVTAVAMPVVSTAQPGEVYTLTFQTPLQDGQPYTLRLAPGLVDEWNLPVVVLGVAFTYSSAGTFYENLAVGYTGAPPLERSALGNVAGFQAHMYDFDAGLIHMRGRVFDPRTGMFLQRDPAGYRDSVNLYAGFKWNPVGLRDPTGRESGFEADSYVGDGGVLARSEARAERVREAVRIAREALHAVNELSDVEFRRRIYRKYFKAHPGSRRADEATMARVRANYRFMEQRIRDVTFVDSPSLADAEGARHYDNYCERTSDHPSAAQGDRGFKMVQGYVDCGDIGDFWVVICDKAFHGREVAAEWVNKSDVVRMWTETGMQPEPLALTVLHEAAHATGIADLGCAAEESEVRSPLQFANALRIREEAELERNAHSYALGAAEVYPTLRSKI
jgi:RHS repeat-associated protein